VVDEQEEARQSELREKEPNLFVVLQKGLPEQRLLYEQLIADFEPPA